MGLTRTIYSVDYDSLRKTRKRGPTRFWTDNVHADKKFIYSSAGKNFTILLMSIAANFWKFENQCSLVKVSSLSCGKKHKSAKLTMKSAAIFKKGRQLFDNVL